AHQKRWHDAASWLKARAGAGGAPSRTPGKSDRGNPESGGGAASVGARLVLGDLRVIRRAILAAEWLLGTDVPGAGVRTAGRLLARSVQTPRAVRDRGRRRAATWWLSTERCGRALRRRGVHQ